MGYIFQKRVKTRSRCDDDDDGDGGGAVDEARSSNTGINERNPEASSNPPIASFSHGVAGTAKELSKRATKKNGKGKSNEKQEGASVPSTTSCAYHVGMNGGAVITVGFGKPKLTKGAQHALQRAKESHQQRARRLKSTIELLSLGSNSSVHVTQYYSMVKGEAVIKSVYQKKISWKST